MQLLGLLWSTTAMPVSGKRRRESHEMCRKAIIRNQKANIGSSTNYFHADYIDQINLDANLRKNR